jgi:hypothetical protein
MKDCSTNSVSFIKPRNSLLLVNLILNKTHIVKIFKRNRFQYYPPSCLDLPCSLFLSDLPAEVLYEFLICVICTKLPGNQMLFDFTVLLIIYDAEIINLFIRSIQFSRNPCYFLQFRSCTSTVLSTLFFP